MKENSARYTCPACHAGGGGPRGSKYTCHVCDYKGYLLEDTSPERRDVLRTKFTGHQVDMGTYHNYNCIHCGDLLSLHELARLQCKSELREVNKAYATKVVSEWPEWRV